MAPTDYDFRKFQAELAALDSSRKPEPPPATAPAPPSRPAARKAVARERLARAREDFLALRARYGLDLADVVSFFPEEEGIAYLQQLLAAAERKPRRTRKPPPAA